MKKIINTKQYNEEVLVAEDHIVKIARQDIDFLINRAKGNKRRRIRICAHGHIDDEVHEMFIVHSKGAYIRPHKHLEKSESFHIIDGLADTIMFDEDGKVIGVIQMGDYSSGCEFYYRISKPFYHTLLIRSDFLVFHETTKGPFKRSDNIFPPWAPDETDIFAQKTFLERLTQEVKIFLSSCEKHF